jgi:trigger factor
MAPKEFASQLVEAGNLPALMGDVRRNKALAGVLESAAITDTSGNNVDLSSLPAPEPSIEAPAEEDVTP